MSTYLNKYLEAFEGPLRAYSLTFSAYCILDLLWEHGPLQLDIINHHLACLERYPQLEEPHSLTHKRIEESLIQMGSLNYVDHSSPDQTLQYEILPSGCIVYEKIHESALGRGAWLCCSEKSYLSKSELRLTAPTQPAIWWSVHTISERFIIDCMSSIDVVPNWKFNQYKMFASANETMLGLAREIVNSEDLIIAESSPTHQRLRQQALTILSTVPPMSWR